MKTADILIIGAGVMGASVAYHLAKKGCKNIIVIDSGNEPGAGSTSRATGGFRCQFATEVNIRLSMLSREKLLRFEEELGIDSGYRQCGYLFLVQNEREFSVMREAQRVQHRCGVKEAEEVTIDDIQQLNPAVVLDGVIGGVFCRTDGFIRPMNILSGYTQAAKNLGVRFEYGVECLGFTTDSSEEKIIEVQTSTATFSVGKIVNAAGAWAGVIARQAGVEIPVTPLRRQVAVVHEPDLLPDTMPMTIFVTDGFHLRVRDGKVLLLIPSENPSCQSFNTDVDRQLVECVAAVARKRISTLSECTIDYDNCWAGLYEMSPDNHAILGRAMEITNFYCINGSSGHGVMHSPALGQILSEIILEKPTTLDVHALRPSRFAEGKLNPVAEFL